MSEHGGNGADEPDDELLRLVRAALAEARRRDLRFVAYLLEIVLIELLQPSHG